MKHTIGKAAGFWSIIYFIALLAVFMTESWVAAVPPSVQLIAFASMTITAMVGVVAGFVVYARVGDVVQAGKVLLDGIEELQRTRGLLVSNEALRDYEIKANHIRVVSPDLFDDFNSFYPTILANVKAGDRYEYLIPDLATTRGKMGHLQEMLRQDGGFAVASDVPVTYRVVATPIVTEYVIYSGGEFSEPKGFYEIRLGNGDSTNCPLLPDEVFSLNDWFDSHF